MRVNNAKAIERLMLQGHSALKQGKNNEAEGHFSTVLKLDPDNKEVLPFRAAALMGLGKKSEAEADLDNQESPAATVSKLLSQANDFMHKQWFDDAEQTILKAKFYDTTSRQKTDAALMLAVLYAFTYRYEEAKVQYKLAQTSMPDDERYAANIIGLNALIRVRELTTQHTNDDLYKLQVEVARDFVAAHEEIIPSYNPGNSLMAKIAISITAGEFDAAEKKLWTSISTNMGYSNLNLSQSALSSSTCLAVTGASIVNNVIKSAEINKQNFTARTIENADPHENNFSIAAA